MLAIWFIFVNLEITSSVPSSASGISVQTDMAQDKDRDGGSIFSAYLG